MISKLRSLVVPLLAGSLVAAGCTSSGGGLSEEEATERVAAVISVFEDAADEEGFSEEEEDEDDDPSEFECEGFEGFNDEDDDAVAEAEFSVTDGGEPEVAGVDGGTIDFEGGEVTGSVKLGVTDDDRLRDSLDAVLDDPDGFADCFQSGFRESLESQDDSSLEEAEFDVDIEIDEGDTGDQEVVISVDGVLSGSSQGLSFELPMNGEIRLIRVDRSGLVASVLSLGDVDADPIQPAIDAAVEEFESQFG